MRRGMTRFAAWLAVTATAVALSWYGVRSVLRGTVFEPPRAPGLAADAVRGPAPDPATLPPAPDTAASAVPEPTEAPATSRPPSSASPRPTSARPASEPAPPTSAPPPTSRAADPPDSAAAVPQPPVIRIDAAPDRQAGSTQSFEVSGGRAAFMFAPDAATLIAATPSSGWAVKVREGSRWIRVDFTRGDRTASVFVSWTGHPPFAVTYES